MLRVIAVSIFRLMLVTELNPGVVSLFKRCLKDTLKLWKHPELRTVDFHFNHINNAQHRFYGQVLLWVFSYS